MFRSKLFLENLNHLTRICNSNVSLNGIIQKYCPREDSFSKYIVFLNKWRYMAVQFQLFNVVEFILLAIIYFHCLLLILFLVIILFLSWDSMLAFISHHSIFSKSNSSKR